MSNKVVVTIRTALKKGAPQKITAMTYDFTGCTVEMLQGPTIDSLSIIKQGAYRRSGAVPAQDAVVVKDMIARMGSRQGPVTPDSVKAQMDTLTPAQIDALIEAKLKERKDAERAAKNKAEGKAEKKNKGFVSQPRPAAPSGTPVAPQAKGDGGDTGGATPQA